MEIGTIINDSLIDYPGKNALVVFSKKCNFNCPSCYARKLNSKKDSINPLDYIGEWTDGVVLLGGEPTINKEIFEFTKELKKRNLSVKLDTNGSNPDIIKRLIEEKLIDYIAMDIKNTPDKYSKTVGVNVNISNIEESMSIITDFGIKHEFRTTIAPIIQDKTQWIDAEDIIEISKWLIKTTKSNNHLYFLQKFIARPVDEMIDKRYSNEELPREFHETPIKLLKDIQDKVRPHLPNTLIRGDY